MDLNIVTPQALRAAKPSHIRTGGEVDVARRQVACVLTLLALCAFINYIDRGNLSIAAPLLKTELGMSASQLGILLSAFFWSYTALLFASGWLVDHLDVNYVLAAGYLLWSLATAATGLVHGFALLLVMRLMLGIGESVAWPSCSKILARHLPEHNRGFANGIIMAAMKCGPAVGAFGAGLLMAKYGWRPVFIGVGLLSLVWLPAWMRSMPRGKAVAPFAAVAPGLIEIVRQRSFWGTVAGLFCGAYPLYFMVTWLPFYIVHEQHLSMQMMAKTAALYFLIDATSSFATGWFTDFWIGRGLTATVVRKSAMALGWTTAAIGLTSCAFAGSQSYLGWLLTAGVGIGMGGSGVFAFSQTLAGARAAGKWVGLQVAIGNFAGVIVPALTGFLLEWTGHFQIALEVTAGVCVLGGLSWVFWVGRVEPVIWLYQSAVDARNAAVEPA
jgi:MFS transporter, ACS family, D-galactonate transporter